MPALQVIFSICSYINGCMSMHASSYLKLTTLAMSTSCKEETQPVITSEVENFPVKGEF